MSGEEDVGQGVGEARPRDQKVIPTMGDESEGQLIR